MAYFSHRAPRIPETSCWVARLGYSDFHCGIDYLINMFMITLAQMYFLILTSELEIFFASDRV